MCPRRNGSARVTKSRRSERRRRDESTIGSRCGTADRGVDFRRLVRKPTKSNGGETRGGERSVVTGRRRAAAARGPDSEPGGDREGLRAAGTSRVRRNREGEVSQIG